MSRVPVPCGHEVEAVHRSGERLLFCARCDLAYVVSARELSEPEYSVRLFVGTRPT